eukprot:4132771-Amphidinium_carterae.1
MACLDSHRRRRCNTSANQGTQGLLLSSHHPTQPPAIIARQVLDKVHFLHREHSLSKPKVQSLNNMPLPSMDLTQNVHTTYHQCCVNRQSIK